MGISITARPETTIETYRAAWGAAHNPMIFTFLRQDHTMGTISSSIDFKARLHVDTDITSEVLAGQKVYFSSSLYPVDVGTVESATYQAGPDETEIILSDVPYVGSNDTGSFYVNLLTARSDYRLDIEINNGLTFIKSADADRVRPFNDGTINFDVTPWLNHLISNDFGGSYSAINARDTGAGYKFYLSWQEYYNGQLQGVKNIDIGNMYFIVNTARQIQDTYGQNLGEHTCFNDSATTHKGKFLCPFENPVYFEGYPFTLNFIYQDDGSGSVIRRAEEPYINGISAGTSVTNLTDTNYNSMHSLQLSGGFSGERVDVWLDSDEGGGNAPPQAVSLSVSGSLEVGQTLTGSYTYTDADADPENTAATQQRWYSYTDAGGSAGETLLGTGATYVLTATELNKYIRFKVIPHALTGSSPGSEAQSGVYGPVLVLETFSFTTNFNPGTDGTFDPQINPVGGPTISGAKYVFEDTSEVSGMSISTSANGLDGTTQTVEFKGAGALTNIEEIDFENDKINGTFDVSTLTNLREILLRTNSGLTTLTGYGSLSFDQFLISNTGISGSITIAATTSSVIHFESLGITSFTVSSGQVLEIFGNSCASLTTVTLSGCTFNGTGTREVDFTSCTSLSTFTLPSSSGGSIGELILNSCPALTSVDISGIEIDEDFEARTSGLTSLTVGNQPRQITTFLIDGNSLSGSLNFGGFTYIPHYILMSLAGGSNTFTDLTLPNGATNIMNTGIRCESSTLATITNLSTCPNLSDKNNWFLKIKNNAMTAGEVNQVLVDLDSVASGGYTGRVVEIHGTNAAPTTGPPDGVAAVASLVSKGFTVTTS